MEATTANDHAVTNVYIAAPIFTPHQKEVIEKIRVFLNEDPRFEYFSPAESSTKIWKGRAPQDCSEEDRDQVFSDNWTNIEWADVLLAWTGGMDEINNKAIDETIKEITNLDAEHPVPQYYMNKFVESASFRKSAPSDTGVTWEMGYAFATATPTLA